MLLAGAAAVAASVATGPAQAAPVQARTPGTRSAAQLATARASLERSARLPGTAWAVDEATHQVVVDVFDNATPATLATVTAVAGSSAGAVRVEHVKGALTRRIAGGDAIYGGGYRCSLGFNVRSSAAPTTS